MSNPVIQELRQASGAAIAELRLPANITRGLTTAVSDMSGVALKGSMLKAIEASPERRSIAGDMAHIVGTVLTHPHLKLPGNKFDSPQNQQLVREVTGKILEPQRRLEIAVGIGGSEDAPSLRFPAYITPALDIARAFVQRAVEPPTIRIFNAHEVSSSINGLRKGVAITRAVQTMDLINTVIAEFYPDIADHVVQEQVDITDLQRNGFSEDTAELLRILHSSEASLTPAEQAIRVQLDKMRRASGKHAGESADEAEVTIAGYAAAHGLTFHNYGVPGVAGVIKLGGQGEAPFDAIQQHMATVKRAAGIAVSNITVDGQPQLINLRMKSGLLPPYYLERDDRGDSPELTVESSPSEIPDTLTAAAAHYSTHRLRTGVDFLLLPEIMQSTLLPHIRDHLAATKRKDMVLAGGQL